MDGLSNTFTSLWRMKGHLSSTTSSEFKIKSSYTRAIWSKKNQASTFTIYRKYV